MATVIQTRTAFDAALAQNAKVILMSMGDGPGMVVVVANADGAILFPDVQCSIWVRDVTIFTPGELADYKPGDPEFVACALSLPPRVVCAYVSRTRATTLDFMDALDAAQKRTQPPIVLR
jgi:hypothetical protein